MEQKSGRKQYETTTTTTKYGPRKKIESSGYRMKIIRLKPIGIHTNEHTHTHAHTSRYTHKHTYGKTNVHHLKHINTGNQKCNETEN